MTPAADAAPARPRRTLGLASLVGITFFCVAGGAYGIEDAVGALGAAWTLGALCVLPWLWSLPTALMTAELSAAMPEDGGYVVWVERAMGRFWGFQEGWWSWLCSLADNALYPVLFTSYLKYWWPAMPPGAEMAIAIGMVAALAWMNVRSTRLVGESSFLFTLAVLAPFAVMVALGLSRVSPSAWTKGPAAPTAESWGVLLSVILWNWCGWDNAGTVGGEVRAPERTYPRAMIATVLIVLASYVLPIAVGVGVEPRWRVWHDGTLPDVARAIGGPWLGTWMMAGGLISALGLLSTLLLTSSRIPYALALRRTLPAPLGRLHARFATPHVSIVVTSAGVIALVVWALAGGQTTRPFVALVQIDMWLYAAALVLEFVALVRLRAREPTMPRPYRIPTGTAGTVLLSIPPLALCAVSMALCPTGTQVLGLSGIAAGMVLYAVSRR